MKASKHVFISAGLGTSIAISGILGVGFLPSAMADVGAATPETSQATNEGGTSSVSTPQTASGQTPPSTVPETGMGTPTQTDVTASPAVESAAAETRPIEEKTSKSEAPVTTSTASPEGESSEAAATPTTKPDTSGVLTGSAPAPWPDPNAETVEIWWAMPHPGTADNVTWPQNYASSDNLQCGITYQVDTYLKSEAQTFTLDGVLNLGEDYQNSTQRGAISWRFVYGGDCAPNVPPKPDDIVNILDSHDVTDCQAGFVTHIETRQTTTYVYDEQHMTWVANVALPITTQTDRDTTEADCPSTPTIPSSPTTPTTIPTPGSGLLAPATTATHTSGPSTVKHQPTAQTLAKTGTNYGAWPWAIGFGLLILGIIAFLIYLFRVGENRD